MDHVVEQSKVDQPDESSTGKGEKPASYYYDDATNYETYRDDDDDESEASPHDNED